MANNMKCLELSRQGEKRNRHIGNKRSHDSAVFGLLLDVGSLNYKSGDFPNSQPLDKAQALCATNPATDLERSWKFDNCHSFGVNDNSDFQPFSGK